MNFLVSNLINTMTSILLITNGENIVIDCTVNKNMSL